MKRTTILLTAFLLALTVKRSANLSTQTYAEDRRLGYYDASTTPVLRIKSGDIVELQSLITSSPTRLEARV